LYCNFVEDLSDDEYLKFSCENKGNCCNIKHLKKFKYQKKEDQPVKDAKVPAPNKVTVAAIQRNSSKTIKIISSRTAIDVNRLHVSFD
jgi:hypothetical protein